jgi:glycosyltransferase involved in cell wall biosynthesis
VKNRSILFIYSNYTSFVRTDFEILSSVCQVNKYQFKPVKGLLNTAVELIKQFYFLLVHIWKYDAAYIWFADYHSLLPVLFAKVFMKKSFLVIGGYEVCRIRNLNYGALCSRIRGFFCVRSMYLSTFNLTVSGYVNRKVKFIAPGSNLHLVYNCVDFEQFTDDTVTKENLVLTVGIIETERSFYLKGIDTFIEVAHSTPEYQFYIIGLDTNKLATLMNDLPANLKIVGLVNHNELPGFYIRAKYYCQFSRSESFGVSVAESMFYGCTPIVTNEGGMPELIGETGHIVSRNVVGISQLINSMPVENTDFSLAARHRIKTAFSLNKRKEKLTTLISNTLK